VRGADTVAVGDGGETLHVPADEPADRFGFCLAQRRELLGNVLDRAVVLADLDALQTEVGTALVDGRGVAVVAQCLANAAGRSSSGSDAILAA